jgi:hypothetical protein
MEQGVRLLCGDEQGRERLRQQGRDAGVRDTSCSPASKVRKNEGEVLGGLPLMLPSPGGATYQPCALSAKGVPSPQSFPQTETAPPRQWCRFQKGVDAGDALHTLYRTFPQEGTAHPIVRASDCASSGGLSLRVAADPEAVNVESEGRKIVRPALLEAPEHQPVNYPSTIQLLRQLPFTASTSKPQSQRSLNL